MCPLGRLVEAMGLMQRARRTNPYPWTWEIPAAIVILLLLLMSLVLHVARATANVVSGSSWSWPPRTELFSAIPDLLAGDASAGLGRHLPQTATGEQLWVWIVVLEFTMLTGSALGLRWAMVRWGPGRILGMASANEVELLLGSSRLRRNTGVIRPDLYGPGDRS